MNSIYRETSIHGKRDVHKNPLSLHQVDIMQLANLKLPDKKTFINTQFDKIKHKASKPLIYNGTRLPYCTNNSIQSKIKQNQGLRVYNLVENMNKKSNIKIIKINQGGMQFKDSRSQKHYVPQKILGLKLPIFNSKSLRSGLSFNHQTNRTSTRNNSEKNNLLEKKQSFGDKKNLIVLNSQSKDREKYNNAPSENFLTESQFKDYHFLQKAASIHITNFESDEDIDMSNLTISKESALKVAIRQTNIYYENKGIIGYEELKTSLNIILENSYSDLTHINDLSILSVSISELLLNGVIKENDLKLKMLAFVIHSCEDSLFSLNFDFNKLYTNVHNYVKRIMEGTETIKTGDKLDIVLMRIMRCYLELHRYFSRNFYLFDIDKSKIILQNFIEIVTINADQIQIDKMIEEQSLSSFYKGHYIPILNTKDRRDIVHLLTYFLKRYELRAFIIENDIMKTNMINLLNIFSNILMHINNENLLNQSRYSKTFVNDMITCQINGFDLFLNIFKYSDQYKLYNSSEPRMSCSFQTLLSQFIYFCQILITCQKGLFILFGVSGETIEYLRPSTPKQNVEHSGFDLLLESFKLFFNNIKLFEDWVINFELLIEPLRGFLDSLNNNIINNKKLDDDFKRFIEGVIKYPFIKILKRIIKRIRSIKGQDYLKMEFKID